MDDTPGAPAFMTVGIRVATVCATLPGAASALAVVGGRSVDQERVEQAKVDDIKAPPEVARQVELVAPEPAGADAAPGGRTPPDDPPGHPNDGAAASRARRILRLQRQVGNRQVQRVIARRALAAAGRARPSATVDRMIQRDDQDRRGQPAARRGRPARPAGVAGLRPGAPTRTRRGGPDRPAAVGRRLYGAREHQPDRQSALSPGPAGRPDRRGARASPAPSGGRRRRASTSRSIPPAPPPTSR